MEHIGIDIHKRESLCILTPDGGSSGGSGTRDRFTAVFPTGPGAHPARSDDRKRMGGADARGLRA